MWGYSQQLWSLAIFVLLYGGTAGGFSILRPRFAAAIVNNGSDKEQSILVFAVLTAMRGVAIVCSGFVSPGLLDEDARITSGFGAGKWSHIILFVGVMLLISSFGALGTFIKAPKTADVQTTKTAETIESGSTVEIANEKGPRIGVGLVISMYEEDLSGKVIEQTRNIVGGEGRA